MASGLVVHVEYGLDKRTEVFTNANLRIGFGEDCDLRLRPVAPVHESLALLELARTADAYRITNFDPKPDLMLNGRVLASEHFTAEPDFNSSDFIIKDADEVQIPSLDLTLRFYLVGAEQAAVVRRGGNPAALTAQRTAYVAPFIENAALESAATARRDDAKVFLREFTRELAREISPLTKITLLLVSGLLITSVFYLGYAMQRSVKQSREQINALNSQLAEMQNRVGSTGDLVTQINESNEQIRSSLSFATKVVGDYSTGVCLISGTYMFVDSATGRPLRYAQLTPEEGEDASASGTTLTPTGNGSIAYFDFVGTGFHVGDGYVLTNRHVAAEPWAADERAQVLQGSSNGRPRMTKLVAYFPNRRTPIPLRLRQTSSREDIAVCSMLASENANDIPALPLEPDAATSRVGAEVVLMGFPSGPERLLAILPDDESRSARARYSGSLEQMLNYLAGREIMTPLVTRGTITDLHTRRIVYDARTAEGGSGAPLFGQQGRVIGINFAVFTENTASNLAVPVRFALPILQQAGWQSRVTTPADSSSDNAGNNAGNNSGKDVRSPVNLSAVGSTNTNAPVRP